MILDFIPIQKEHMIFHTHGSSQTFTTETKGVYKLEVWGAQGGVTTDREDYYVGGATGGYSVGYINLRKINQQLYVYVGGVASSEMINKGFNGGFNGGGSVNHVLSNYPGGGATDIRLIDGNWNNLDSLISRIIVAGGGGGNSASTTFTNYHIPLRWSRWRRDRTKWSTRCKKWNRR